MTGLGQVGALGRLGAPALARGGWWLSGSALDLDFANNRAFNRSTGFNGSPNGILTYTSPSPKLVYGDDGVLRYAPHNLVLNSGFSLGTDGALPTSWLERGVVTLRRRASENCAVLAAGTGGTVGASDDACEVISGLQAGKQFYVTFKAALDPASVANVLTAVFAGTSINCNLTSGYQDFSFVSTASGTSHSLFFGNAIGAVSNLVALIKDVQVAVYPVHSEYIPTTSAAVYSLPVDHDPVTFEPLGVLIAEQRTNLLLQSQTFGTTWNVQRCSVVANAALGGDGTQTADALVEDSASGSHQLHQSVSKAASSIQYALSVEIEPQSRTWCRLQASTGGEANFASTWFDLSGSGAVGTSNVSGSGFTNHSSSIKLLPNGRYKLVMVFTSDTGATVTIGVKSAESNGGIAHVGNSLTAFYLWGAQLEAGAFATSYIPTVASQVTRAADQVSILTSAFAFNAAEGTMLGWGTTETLNSALGNLVQAADSGNNRIAQYVGSSYLGLIVTDASVNQAVLSPATTNDSTFKKVASGYKANDFAVSLNGGSAQTAVAGTVPTVDTLRFGRQSTVYLNGHIKRLTYFPTRKTNAELQALTS